MYQSNNQ